MIIIYKKRVVIIVINLIIIIIIIITTDAIWIFVFTTIIYNFKRIQKLLVYLYYEHNLTCI